jgi:hypothetical protein
MAMDSEQFEKDDSYRNLLTTNRYSEGSADYMQLRPRFSGLSYRGQLGEGTEGPRGRGQGGSSLEGAVRGGCGVKVAVKGVD